MFKIKNKNNDYFYKWSQKFRQNIFNKPITELTIYSIHTWNDNSRLPIYNITQEYQLCAAWGYVSPTQALPTWTNKGKKCYFCRQMKTPNESKTFLQI